MKKLLKQTPGRKRAALVGAAMGAAAIVAAILLTAGVVGANDGDAGATSETDADNFEAYVATVEVPDSRLSSVTLPPPPSTATPQDLVRSFRGMLGCLEGAGILVKTALLQISDYHVQAEWDLDLAASLAQTQANGSVAPSKDHTWFTDTRLTCQAEFVSTQQTWNETMAISIPDSIENQIEVDCSGMDSREERRCGDEIFGDLVEGSMRTLYSQ
ncbi:MAG: hypothetical protein OES13_04315 [Acidimicrobiia bacterium]|nr:hypothetical protein [Acidimicrobiia bacterium]